MSRFRRTSDCNIPPWFSTSCFLLGTLPPPPPLLQPCCPLSESPNPENSTFRGRRSALTGLQGGEVSESLLPREQLVSWLALGESRLVLASESLSLSLSSWSSSLWLGGLVYWRRWWRRRAAMEGRFGEGERLPPPPPETLRRAPSRLIPLLGTGEFAVMSLENPDHRCRTPKRGAVPSC